MRAAFHVCSVLLIAICILAAATSCERTRSYGHTRPQGETLKLRLDAPEAGAIADAQSIHGTWEAGSQWEPNGESGHRVTLEVFDPQQGSTHWRNMRVIGMPPAEVITTSPGTAGWAITKTSPAGTLLLSNMTDAGSIHPRQGVFTIEPNKDVVQRIDRVFGTAPEALDLLQLILADRDIDQIVALRTHVSDLTLRQAMALDAANWNNKHILALTEAGYRFNGEDLAYLAQRHVKIDYAIAWRKAEYQLSAEKLHWAKSRHLDPNVAAAWRKTGRTMTLEQLHWVKSRHLKSDYAASWDVSGRKLSLKDLHWVKSRHIKPTYAKSWAAADRNLSLKQLHWAKSRHLKPDDARSWDDAGHKLSLEQLHWAKSRHLKPEYARSWTDSGYKLNLEQLHWAKSRHLSPSDAAAWRKAGYDFSLDDLHKLKSYHITADWAAALNDPDYEPLTVNQLIKLKQSHVTPATVKRLRTKRAVD